VQTNPQFLRVQLSTCPIICEYPGKIQILVRTVYQFYFILELFQLFFFVVFRNENTDHFNESDT